MASPRSDSRLVWLLALVLSACGSDAPPSERRPQQAGQPMSVAETTLRVAAARGAAVTGDGKAVQQQVHALADDFRRSMRLADPSRAVDRELARAVAREVAGVRSVVWLDHENLFATVDSAQARSYATIDRICLALEPLGDTLGVVVNLQNSAARKGRELDTLSRNCQLMPGERALLSRKRELDPIDPRIRAQHEANQTLSQQTEEELARQEESMRVLQRTTKPLQR